MLSPPPISEPETNASQRRLQDQARLEGVRLAARTLEHHLTNDLMLTVGYAELLSEDPELPERLRNMARQVFDGARGAVETVWRMRRVEEVVLVGPDLPAGPLLELAPPTVQ